MRLKQEKSTTNQIFMKGSQKCQAFASFSSIFAAISQIRNRLPHKYVADRAAHTTSFSIQSITGKTNHKLHVWSREKTEKPEWLTRAWRHERRRQQERYDRALANSCARSVGYLWAHAVWEYPHALPNYTLALAVRWKCPAALRSCRLPQPCMKFAADECL